MIPSQMKFMNHPECDVFFWCLFIFGKINLTCFQDYKVRFGCYFLISI